jgi:hypothetical protein
LSSVRDKTKTILVAKTPKTDISTPYAKVVPSRKKRPEDDIIYRYKN